jgi:hypothetical protein
VNKGPGEPCCEPASLMWRVSMMAKFLPTTAMSPLSKYRNGRGAFRPRTFLEIRTEDATVVRFGVAHIGLVHITGGAVDHQAVWNLPAFLEERLEI